MAGAKMEIDERVSLQALLLWKIEEMYNNNNKPQLYKRVKRLYMLSDNLSIFFRRLKKVTDQIKWWETYIVYMMKFKGFGGISLWRKRDEKAYVELRRRLTAGLQAYYK